MLHVFLQLSSTSSPFNICEHLVISFFTQMLQKKKSASLHPVGDIDGFLDGREDGKDVGFTVGLGVIIVGSGVGNAVKFGQFAQVFRHKSFTNSPSTLILQIF
mmetsp:Transcript_17253/g.26309  ORF Transcript_17253/g.26309 Transcript_17253/m.26309 type:complete len:103 (-) Transcript_17253:76-384(-)